MNDLRLYRICVEKAALRDALLPKLLSGEIRMKDGENYLV